MGIGFDNLNGGAKKSDIKYMKLNEGLNTFRILPKSVLPGYTYWVKGANGKDLPFEALQFDRNTETFNNAVACPIRDAGIKDHEGKDIRCQWSYKCQVINKATGEVEILQLKKGMLQEIISVARQLQTDPTDLENGFWITVEKKKTGPKVFNVEYGVQQLMCKPAPLEDEFRPLVEAAKPIDEMFKRETYEEQSTRLHKHLNGVKDDDNGSTEQNSTGSVDKEAIDELEQ